MGCSHATGCPLFPYLRSSLAGWREYYCDSDDRWQDCARYKLSLKGERMPITLLPNGHHAAHLQEEAGATSRSVTLAPDETPQQSGAPYPRARHQAAPRGPWARLVSWMRGPA